MTTYTAPQVGDTLIVRYAADEHFAYHETVATVLEVETIPPHKTVTPDVPRWAMWVRLVSSTDSDNNWAYRPGTEHYWPGMGPGDFDWVQS